MKYLKGTIIAFAVTLIFSMSVNAASLTLSNMTIPIFGGIYNSPERVKGNDKNTQKLETINVIDRLSGDGRIVLVRTVGTLAGMPTTSWYETTKGKTVNFGEVSREIGSWKLQIKSKKSLPTKAGYWGIWTYE